MGARPQRRDRARPAVTIAPLSGERWPPCGTSAACPAAAARYALFAGADARPAARR